MAISMSGDVVETGKRDALLGSSVNGSVTSGGVTANTQSNFNILNPSTWGSGDDPASGAKLAGVTSTFATNVCSAIDTYIQSVTAHINAMEEANSAVAFQGSGVSDALKTFINSVKQVANDYADRLKGAEQEIINSVQDVYTKQDTHLSGELGADSTTLTSSNSES